MAVGVAGIFNENGEPDDRGIGWSIKYFPFSNPEPGIGREYRVQDTKHDQTEPATPIKNLRNTD